MIFLKQVYIMAMLLIISVTQIRKGNISAEFDIDVDENQLIIYFAGQVYLVLQK